MHFLKIYIQNVQNVNAAQYTPWKFNLFLIYMSYTFIILIWCISYTYKQFFTYNIYKHTLKHNLNRHTPIFKSHVCQNVRLLAISSGWVGGVYSELKNHAKNWIKNVVYYSNLDRTTFLWNLFFIFGLDPLTHIHTLEKGESDSTLK